MSGIDTTALVGECMDDAFQLFLERCHPSQKEKLTDALRRLKDGSAEESDATAVQMALDLARGTEWAREDGQPHRLQREEVEDTDRLALLHPQRHDRVRHSIHVYGYSAALCVEPTQYGEQVPGIVNNPAVHTVMFEMAKRKAVGAGYDWAQKLQFRLTRRELPLAAAAVLGLIPELKLMGHGPSNDKRLEIRNQPGKVFLRLTQRTTVMALPITYEDLFMVGTRILEALVRNTNGLDSSLVMQLIHRVVDVYNEAHEAQND